MRPADLMGMALSNLWRRKLRTFLTVFAVVIGATLVSLMVSLGAGIQEFMMGQFEAFMPRDALMATTNPKMNEINFNMGGGAPSEVGAEGEMMRSFRSFKPEEIAWIKDLAHVERVDRSVRISAESIKLKGGEKRYRVFPNTGPPYQLKLRRLVAGKHLEDASRGEIILAYQYLEVFGWIAPEEALGQEVVLTVPKSGLRLFSGQSQESKEKQEFAFHVVGVTEKTLNSSEAMISQEDAREIARYMTGNPKVYTDEDPTFDLQVKVTDRSQLAGVAKAIRDHGLGALTVDEALGMIGTMFAIVEGALSLVGLIALGVASLGIINTLVMAIYERTREIGVMKAVGASRGTVRLLFTIEGGMIGFLGGAIGLLIGWALGALLNEVAHATFLSEFRSITLSVFPIWLVLGVVALSTAVALVAALYPANRAAGLDPIEALRYE